jgi:hypothetical protein
MTRKNQGPVKRIAVDVAGFGLILLGLLTGWLPGPGGIPLILAGLGVLSLNYEWARRLLKDFDNKRVELTEKYLNSGPPASWFNDIAAGLFVVAGPLLIIFKDSAVIKGLGVGLIFTGLTLGLSNQRRIDRMLKRFLHK